MYKAVKEYIYSAPSSAPMTMIWAPSDGENLGCCF